MIVQQDDRIARVRAHMMHVLYELGKPEHQFRLRFKGNYLRDAHTFEVSKDYSQDMLYILHLTQISYR